MPRVCTHWREDEIDLLHDLWGTLSRAEVARRVSALGTPRTASACAHQARREGLSAYTAHGWILLAEAARRLGLHPLSLRGRIKAMGLRTQRGAFECLTLEQFARLEAVYPALSPEMLTTKAAARLLGYADISCVWYAIKRGAIKGQRWGRYWMIPRAEIERVKWERARERRRQEAAS